MKKLIFTLLLLLTSCNKYIVSNVYEKTYPTKEIALPDVYNKLNQYKLDSIPLNEWITNYLVADSMQIEQKTIKNTIDKNTQYIFVFTTYTYPYIKCICPERYSYQFLIRYKGK